MKSVYIGSLGYHDIFYHEGTCYVVVDSSFIIKGVPYVLAIILGSKCYHLQFQHSSIFLFQQSDSVLFGGETYEG